MIRINVLASRANWFCQFRQHMDYLYRGPQIQILETELTTELYIPTMNQQTVTLTIPKESLEDLGKQLAEER